MTLKERVSLQFSGFVKTPPLWNSQKDFPLAQFALPEPKLEGLKTEEFLPIIPPKLPLGKRVEYFFHSFIQNFSSETVLANNLQVFNDKITIVELDFLLQNKNTGKITHVELVYKFYVYDPSFETEKSRWIGPNRRDSLLKKLEKLQKQQFPMLFKPETQVLLKKMGITAEETSQEVCFKAFVFLPKDFSKQKIPLINNNCIAGYWIHFEEFTAEAYENHGFFAPQKQDWSIDPQYCENWSSYATIKEEIIHIFQNKKAPLIWMKKDNGQYERFFVVWW